MERFPIWAAIQQTDESSSDRFIWGGVSLCGASPISQIRPPAIQLDHTAFAPALRRSGFSTMAGITLESTTAKWQWTSDKHWHILYAESVPVRELEKT